MFNIFKRPVMGAPPEKRELLSVLLSFKKEFFALMGFSCVINFLLLVPAIYMLQTYDRVLTSRNPTTLIMLTIIALAMYVFLGFLEWVRSQVLIRIGNRMDKRLSGSIFVAAFGRSLQAGSGNASQPFNDFTNLRQFLTGSGLFAFFDAPFMPIYLVVIFIIHPILGVFSLVSAFILLVLAMATEFATRKPLLEASRMNNVSTTFASANFRSAEAIEAMGMLNNVRNHWYPKHERFLRLQTKASERASVIQASSKFARLTFQSAILGLGAYLALQQIITPGMMIAASILMGRALSPVDMAIGVWKQFISARDSYKRLEEIIRAFPERERGMPLPIPKGVLSVSNIIVVPPGSSQQVLKGVTLEAFPGEPVAIIGPSGAGKSTLARAIVGLWPPLIGSVRLDGAETFKWNKEELGRYIGYLPQDIDLLNGTIAENIARFGEIDSESVIKASQAAGIHEIVLQFPKGYDTPIGEGGVILSAGQRQRVALARALYGDPVLIVLDEPNSNLDEAGEIALVNALMQLKAARKTIFVITHRTLILSVMNKILLLSNGTIQLYGPRDEVIMRLKQAQERAS